LTNYIYAYTNPAGQRAWRRADGTSGDFLIKVGKASDATENRALQQQRTATPNLSDIVLFFYGEEAIGPNISAFTDKHVHALLRANGIKQVDEGGGTEWFEATPDEVRAAVVSLQTGVAFSPTRTQSFQLRPEQKVAVAQTASYFRAHPGGSRYLWNAKMRFGKTYTTYMLAKEMHWRRILVLTYKPAVRSAWRDDLLSHTEFAGWRFIDRQVPTEEADRIVSGAEPVVWFASFQDATGTLPDGSVKPHNETIHLVDWDCIVVDESHYGAGTSTARELYDPDDAEETALAVAVEAAHNQESEKIADVLPDFTRGLNAAYRLHLSGTPFKAIVNGDYAPDQVYNWTYIDEQRAKQDWPADHADQPNPYAELPQMQMFIYRLPPSAVEMAQDGDDGFSLNVFFEAKREDRQAQFARPDNVAKFLDLIRGAALSQVDFNDDGRPPFPFEAARFREGVEHSIWYLPDVAACEAMAGALRSDPFYSQFEVHVAAGTTAGTGAGALEPAREAIRRAEVQGKAGSITLSCGKLMTGVTVPEWSSILMLRSLKAPESYFHAAFRVQSPWVREGNIKKKTAYIFEFDPNRALSLVALYGTEIANNTNDRDATQRTVLGDLLNFLPIFAIDGGSMTSLDVEAIIDWANAGVDANSLARKWRSIDLYNLNSVTMSRLLDDPELLAELEQIEDFRNIREEADKIVTKTAEIERVKREGASRADSNKPRKELAERRKSIRDKLKKISAKVLIFMYLTDFREERLLHIIESLDSALFLKSTGLSIDGFRRLVDVGAFDVSQYERAIQQFRHYERASVLGEIQLQHELAASTNSRT
jgi:hypothetical protein